MNNDQWDKLDSKLDKIQEHMASVDVTLAKQEVSLAEHMKRSDLLEESVSFLRKDFTPVQRHVIIVTGLLRLIGVLSALLVIAVSLKELLGK